MGFVVLGGVHYLLFLLSWWLVGRGALTGRLEVGWLLAWALLLLTLIPLRLLAAWWKGQAALSAGRLLRQRLLYGALRLEPEEIRHKGAGQLLGSVLESEAVEQLALHGGFGGLVAVIELGLAAVVLGLGAGGPGHAALLLGWLGLGLVGMARHLGQRKLWTDARVRLTDSLVERMVGHRTVLAQEAPGEWADERDLEIDGYLRRSQALDRTMSLLTSLLSRGWLVVGLGALAPAFLDPGTGRGALAVALGAVLLASRSFRRLALSAAQLTGAIVAWREVAPFFDAASRPEALGSPRAAPPARGVALEGSELVFRYPDRDEPVLSGCDLRVRPGDRVLVEGPSGGGKSTLAALLMGLRAPQAGLLLVEGLDRATLGERGWRRRVSGAPQFHENLIVSDTLAFNLLMGHRWPPTPEDVSEAEAVCRALDLGPLLERMPAGLLQIVGDTGWQLSHGERSRVYIARALLQKPALLILDESFGALDPETLATAMKCVRKRAGGLVVIAHP
jgi:ATP-binding cassette subfamily B protein